MALIARKLQEAAQDRVKCFIAEHAEALEPGLSVLETSLRLGRATIDVVALDAKRTLVLIVAGEVADEKMLVSTLDAYIWFAALPDSLNRLYPTVPIAITRPPRVIFVAERIPDTFLKLLEQLSMVSVECQELSSPAIPAPHALPVAPVAPEVAASVGPMSPLPRPSPSPSAEPRPVAAGFAAAVAHQWEPADAATDGRTNGHSAPVSNGHVPAAPQAAANSTFTQAMRAAETSIEHAVVDLGAPAAASPAPPALRPSGPAAPVQPAKPAAPSAADESSAASHPALESLKFPKGGVSRQWQDFLDQLAAVSR